jgi:hypothetical protein
MHYSTNPDNIKIKIEKLGHMVTNIWNTKQYRTKLPLSMFFVDLKPAPNNKDIFNVEYTQNNKQTPWPLVRERTILDGWNTHSSAK